MCHNKFVDEVRSVTKVHISYLDSFVFEHLSHVALVLLFKETCSIVSIGLENYSNHFKFHLYFQCPMYDKSTDEEVAGPSSNPVELMDDMRRDGLTFKQCVLGRKNNFTAENQVWYIDVHIVGLPLQI